MVGVKPCEKYLWNFIFWYFW